MSAPAHSRHLIAGEADRIIRDALPFASDALLAALRDRLVHREQLRRLGVSPRPDVGSGAVQKVN